MRGHLTTVPLALVDLARVAPLAHAEAVHVADPARQVTQVVLAETFERLRTITAHSLVVLHAEAATGGWSLATALHVAWERHACAVVVPRAAMSRSSVVLAERLGISLFVIESDPVDAALVLAGQVSAPHAARALRVADCAQRLAEQSSLRGVLGVLNAELAPAHVALLVGTSVAAGRAIAVGERAGHRQVRVEVDAFGGRAWAQLVASVPEATWGAAGHVEAVLRLGRLPLLAAWAQSRLSSSERAAEEMAAFAVMRRLVDGPAREARGSVDDDDAADIDVDVPAWSNELGWSVDGVNRAVRILPRRDAVGGPSSELTQLVRAAWQRHRPDWPIITDGDGWVSWRNSAQDDGPAVMRRALAALAPLTDAYGVVLGVGGAHPGVRGLMLSDAEARLAAHTARDGAGASVEWFDQLGVRSALSWLPVPEITRVADLCLPDLIAARDRTALVETVLAVLDCGGSLSAASALLGVHRNTVLARLARAKTLGLVLQDPAQRFALHVICHALASRDGLRQAPVRGSRTPDRPPRPPAPDPAEETIRDAPPAGGNAHGQPGE